MVLNNSKTTNEIKTAYGLTNLDAIPTPAPVVNVNPKDYRTIDFCKSASVATTAGAGVHTASSTRKTYITNIIFSFSKNAGCDIATGQLLMSVSIGGNTVYPVSLAVLTLVSEQGRVSVHFPTPLLIDKGSQVIIVGRSFTAGALVQSASVCGYEVEDNE